MSAPEHDELERRLTALFQQRAATVTTARPVDLDPAGGSRKAADAEAGRDRRRRNNLGVLAAAAAGFVAIAGTVVGIQANRHQPAPPLGTPTASPTSSPSGDRCVVQAPASWRQAIQNGALPAAPAPTNVVSVNGGTGDYLILQGNEPSKLTLGVFNGGLGRTFYTTQTGSGFLQIDRTSAVTARYVTYALVTQQGGNYYYEVVFYDRATQYTRELAGFEPPENFVRRVTTSPVIAAGKLYWLSSYDSRPETTRLESFDLARDSGDDPVPAANATGLIGYGSGVALVRSTPSNSTLANGAGTPLTKAQLAAAAGGSNFGFDGVDKLSWLRYDDQGRPTYYSLIVGGTEVSHGKPMSHAAGIAAAVYPFTDVELDNAEVSDNSLLDLRTGAAVTLPAGVRMQAVVGTQVLFGIGTTEAGSARLSLVPRSALPPVRC